MASSPPNCGMRYGWIRSRTSQRDRKVQSYEKENSIVCGADLYDYDRVFLKKPGVGNSDGTGEYGRDGKRGDSSDTGRDDGASYH